MFRVDHQSSWEEEKDDRQEQLFQNQEPVEDASSKWKEHTAYGD